MYCWEGRKMNRQRLLTGQCIQWGASVHSSPSLPDSTWLVYMCWGYAAPVGWLPVTGNPSLGLVRGKAGHCNMYCRGGRWADRDSSPDTVSVCSSSSLLHSTWLVNNLTQHDCDWTHWGRKKTCAWAACGPQAESLTCLLYREGSCDITYCQWWILSYLPPAL